MKTVVVDFFQAHDPVFYDCLAKAGINGIARYLTNTMDDPRQITRAEIDMAHAAGLTVHFFFETSGNYPAYFTYTQGAEDCRQAMDRLAELGAPPSTTVYFAVDVNLDPALTINYFNGVESMVTPAITPGVYGYQRMCEFARTNFPNIGKHLAQTYGALTGSLDLWQNYQDVLCGVEVDWNDCFVEGWKGEDVTKDEYIAPDPSDGKSLEDRVKETDRVLWIAEFVPQMRAELAQSAHDTETKAVVTALLDVLESALKPKPTDVVPPTP